MENKKLQRAITICLNAKYWYSIVATNENEVLCEKAYKSLLFFAIKKFYKDLNFEQVTEFISKMPSWENFLAGNMDITWKDKLNNFFLIYKSFTSNPDILFSSNE